MENRLIDNFKCNPNLDPDCNVYELEEPMDGSLRYLVLNYAFQPIILYYAVNAGSSISSNTAWGDLTVMTLSVLLLVDIYFITLPSFLLILSGTLGIFKSASIWLIQHGLLNLSFVTYCIGIFNFALSLAMNKNQMSARVFLTYTPLALFSFWMQVNLGVDAIRMIDPSWDEHRGPLYPSFWYSKFRLYDPHSEPDVEVGSALFEV